MSISMLWLQRSVVRPRWIPANCPLAWRRWCPLRTAHSRWRTWARPVLTPGRGTSASRATIRITVAASSFIRAVFWHRATASLSKPEESDHLLFLSDVLTFGPTELEMLWFWELMIWTSCWVRLQLWKACRVWLTPAASHRSPISPWSAYLSQLESV